MKIWLALRSTLVVMAVVAISMLVVWLLVSHGAAKELVPAPDTVAENFLEALGAHRYEGALNEMSQDLEQQVSEKDLRKLIQAIEQMHQGIEDVSGQDAQEQGDQATATIKLRFEDQSEQTIQMQLKRENYLWRVDSIDALRKLREK